MNHPPDSDPVSDGLLADVLAEGAAPGLRDATLDTVLRGARQRRRVRQLRRVGTAGAVLAAIVLSLWTLRSPAPATGGKTGPVAEGPSVQVVHTRPLPAAAVVRTAGIESAPVIRTAAAAAVMVVHTTRGAGIRWLSDDELLASAAPQPAVLVRIGPGEQRLVIPTSEGTGDVRPN